uniref:Receptor-like serine/threonine-protein kinase n=1 Tax=Chenopodium quinoa TaxID=63459 RepID=A0A803LL24_CHEQI
MEVVWVANRNNPLTDTSGVLKISLDGNLQVSDAKNQTVWSSNVTHPTAGFVAAQLQDSGNLVIQGFPNNTSRGNGTIIWQSFQHPADSVLPNMRFILNNNSEFRKVLQAWKSPSDPSVGRYHNTGYGNILINTGSFAQEEVGGMLSLVFTGANETLLPRYVITDQGILAERWWDDSKKNWGIAWHAPENICDTYGMCGEFGNCNPQTKPICSCLKGFVPKNEEEWRRGNWKNGCVRRKKLQCGIQGGKEDGFQRLKMMKVPDNAEWIVGLNPDQCRTTCLANCSCLAYTHDTGTGCMRWSENLIDIEDLSPGGVDLFIRLEQSELSTSKRKIAIIVVCVTLGTAVIATIMYFLFKWRAREKGKHTSDRYRKSKSIPEKKSGKKAATNSYVFRDKTQVMIEDLQVSKLEDLIIATDGFSESNLLGKGGFGQVFKGKLENGQEIAVKRLSRASGQGVEEFMNEVELISKLQHRNLVKLLGCCVEGEEKMLIYEYMPNKSLDAFLFDPQKQELSQWHKRFNIIQGICRGLLYLHRDSRLKIIHRDLKPSNILLDQELNPKISDFGMARIFGGNQDQASTQRVVGTYGYMSSEYAMEGHFSEKSDVFSFGVLLLEIVSGKKNSSFWYQEDFLSLLGYTWKLWNDNTIETLIDPTISSPDFQEEILRCIHVGLLCVQEIARDRPNTSVVMSMLVRDIMDLPSPKAPGYTQRQISADTGSSQITDETSSTNHVTITTLTAR